VRADGAAVIEAVLPQDSLDGPMSLESVRLRRVDGRSGWPGHAAFSLLRRHESVLDQAELHSRPKMVSPRLCCSPWRRCLVPIRRRRACETTSPDEKKRSARGEPRELYYPVDRHERPHTDYSCRPALHHRGGHRHLRTRRRDHRAMEIAPLLGPNMGCPWARRCDLHLIRLALLNVVGLVWHRRVGGG